jgi:hypothetical protein
MRGTRGASFGQWVGCDRRRCWQVAATLLYGQMPKCYRQRRLVRIRYGVLCGTGILAAAAGAARLRRIYPQRSRGLYERDAEPYDRPARVFGACAGAAMYRGHPLLPRMLLKRRLIQLVARRTPDEIQARLT